MPVPGPAHRGSDARGLAGGPGIHISINIEGISVLVAQVRTLTNTTALLTTSYLVALFMGNEHFSFSKRLKGKKLNFNP